MKLKTFCFTLFFLIVCSQDRSSPATYSFMYEPAGETTSIITGLIGNADSLVIPGRIGNRRVASVAKWAFVHTPISQLLVSDGILSIGEAAFAHGKKLETVVLPNSLSSIGREAFQENKLTAIDIPANVSSVGQYAFSYNNITRITFSPKMTEISFAAFYNNNLTSIRIPENIKTINVMAFAKNKIREIYIPENVRIIHYDEAARIKVNIEPQDNVVFEYNFEDFYAKNNKRAGRYFYVDEEWIYEDVMFTASVSELPPSLDKQTDAKNKNTSKR